MVAVRPLETSMITRGKNHEKFTSMTPKIKWEILFFIRSLFAVIIVYTATPTSISANIRFIMSLESCQMLFSASIIGELVKKSAERKYPARSSEIRSRICKKVFIVASFPSQLVRSPPRLP